MNALTADILNLIASRSNRALTTCRICGISLKDPTSVALGIGPVCRKKHNYQSTLDAVRRDLRPLAVAALKSATAATGDDILPELSILRTLGFNSIVDAIERRMAIVELNYIGDSIEVRHGFSTDLWSAIRQIPGVRWNKDEKKHVLPRAARPFLTAALRQVIPGCLGWSNTGGLFCVYADPTVTRWSLTAEIDAAALDQAAALLAQSDRADVREEGARMAALATGDNGTQTDWRANQPLPEDFYAI